MKELLEKINALYAEFEKDATAQAVKRQVLEQEKFHSLSRRSLRILEKHHLRRQSNCGPMI